MGKVVGNRQLLLLFVCSVVILFAGMGLFPLLPLYAAQFGATRATTGFYIASLFASFAAGSMLTGWLVRRLSPRLVMAGSGLVGMVAFLLLGRATSLWQVIALTSVGWFTGGIGLTLANLLTGLVALKEARGKSFSLMSMATPVGALAGGAAVGQLVAWQGYPLMFTALAGLWSALPLIGLFGIKAENVWRAKPGGAQPKRKAASPLSGSFYVLLVAYLLATMAIRVGRVGTSLSMQALDFSPRAVASTSMVGGLAVIPVALGIGALSDRLGRSNFLMLGYLMAAGGTLMLTIATDLWHFWLAATLILSARSVGSAIASAFAADMLEPQALTRALPWLNATPSLAGIVGIAGSGVMMDTLGPNALYLLVAALAVVAAVQIGLLQRPQNGLPAAKVVRPWPLARRPSHWSRVCSETAHSNVR
jgi:MFS family permease